MPDNIVPIFSQMLVLFLIIALGYAGGKTKVMTIEGNKTLSLLVNCITNPCTILYSSLCTEHVLSNGEVFILLGTAFAMYLVLILIAQLVPKLLKVPAEQKGQYKYMMVFSNVGYMGIPVIRAIFGADAVFCVSVFIMVFYLFVYTYGIYLIRGGKGSGGFQWKDIFSPMMVSSLVSIVCYLLDIRVDGVIAQTLSTVEKVTTPCAMLIIGCALSSIPFRTVFSNWRLYVVAVLKLLAFPCLAYLCLKPVISNTMILGVAVVIMAMPVATNFTMLSAQYDKDQKLSSSVVFLTTLLSVLTIPILAGVLTAS